MAESPSHHLMTSQELSKSQDPVTRWMVESSVWWGVVIGSHLIPSAFVSSDHQALQADIANLRVEVHRARELISGYNGVLEACESSTYWLKWANSCLFLDCGDTLLRYFLDRGLDLLRQSKDC